MLNVKSGNLTPKTSLEISGANNRKQKKEYNITTTTLANIKLAIDDVSVDLHFGIEDLDNIIEGLIDAREILMLSRNFKKRKNR